MIKIELKTIFGEVAFTWESEKNTPKETVRELLKQNRDNTISFIDLSGLDLSGIDFSNSTFDNSKFDNSKFDNSTFYNSKFDNSTFYNSTFDNSKFDNSKFDNSKFDNSKFDNSKFDNSTFYNSTFDNSTFDNSKFDNSKFYNSKFDNSKFDAATIKCLIESKHEYALNNYRNDMWAKMLFQIHEVEGLRQKLVEGKINGTCYEGECSCFCGTIATIKGSHYKELDITADANSPVEQWFAPILPGMTPENNEIVKITVKWIDEFMFRINIAKHSPDDFEANATH